MRITIELDENTVQAVDVRPAVPVHLTAEPPPELLAAARRLGAASAGIAAFSVPAGTSVALGTLTAAAVGALGDVDAGQAVAGSHVTRPVAKKSRAKAAKGGR